jgi:hypothetical protein
VRYDYVNSKATKILPHFIGNDLQPDNSRRSQQKQMARIGGTPLDIEYPISRLSGVEFGALKTSWGCFYVKYSNVPSTTDDNSANINDP